MKEFLNHHFSTRVDNATRRQWREKDGAPRLSSNACLKLDKILKPSLTSKTKTKDRKLSTTQALVLDAAGPLAAIVESATRGNFDADATINVQRSSYWGTQVATLLWKGGETPFRTSTPT